MQKTAQTMMARFNLRLERRQYAVAAEIIRFKSDD